MQAGRAEAARGVEAKASGPAPPEPGRKRVLDRVIVPTRGQRRQTAQHGVHESRGGALRARLARLNAFTDGGMVGHAIEKAHLVCADLNGDEDARIQLIGTAAGDAGDERLQLGAAADTP